jgi:uncharacterized protein YjdB
MPLKSKVSLPRVSPLDSNAVSLIHSVKCFHATPILSFGATNFALSFMPMKKILVILILCCLSNKLLAQSGIIYTVAGNGTTAYSGDGGPAATAGFQMMQGTTFDKYGNLYIVDQIDYRVRKITPSGIVTTVAGIGSIGFSGDGGPATAAALQNPFAACFDTSGNMYISDLGNARIRKVTPAGIISTIVGTGTPGYSGDGGPATAAQITGASDVKADKRGNLYINDFAHGYIRKINASGIITKIAGTGTVGYTGDGGPATAAQVALMGFWPDDHGNLYFADNSHSVIRVIDSTGIISTFAGVGWSGFGGDGGTRLGAAFHGPISIVMDSCGNMFVADYNNLRIRKISNTGIVSTVAGNGLGGSFRGDYGPATAANMSPPEALGIDPEGNLTYVDHYYYRARKVVLNQRSIAAITGSHAVCAGATTTLSDSTLVGVWSSGAASVATVNDSTGVVYGVAAGTAVITYTYNNTCSGVTVWSDTQRITVDSVMPAVSPINGLRALCTGTSITLSDTTYGGMWLSSNPGVAAVNSIGTVTGASAGNVIISYTRTNGCGMGGDTQLVSVNTLPATPTVNGLTRVCAGNTINLTATGSGGVWTSSNTALATVSATGTVTGLSSGLDTVYYTVANSCGSAAGARYITVVGTDSCNLASLEAETNIPEIRLFPNPNYGAVAISLPAQGGPVTIEILDAMGKVVLTDYIETPATKELDVQALPAGIYLLRAINTHKTTTIRFQKQ